MVFSVIVILSFFLCPSYYFFSLSKKLIKNMRMAKIFFGLWSLWYIWNTDKCCFLIWTWFFHIFKRQFKRKERAIQYKNAHILFLKYYMETIVECHSFKPIQATMTPASCHEYFTSDQRPIYKPYQFGICSHYYSWPRAVKRSCFQTHFLIIFQVSSFALLLLGGQFSLCRKATKNNTIRWLMSFSVRVVIPQRNITQAFI